MNKLPSRYILTIKPAEYLRGLGHCGVYCIKAILSAYERDDKKLPQEYHTNWLSKHTISMAWGKTYYDKIFHSYGIESQTQSAENLLSKDQINLLKSLLVQNKPIMVRIGNGYLSNNVYNPFWGRIIPHWITLWGYDHDKQLFYVYDSGLPVRYWDKSLPVGNTIRTYMEILRDWNFGRWKPWCWNNSSKNNLYITISS